MSLVVTESVRVTHGNRTYLHPGLTRRNPPEYYKCMSEYTRSDEIQAANRRKRQVEQHLADTADQRAYDPDDPFAGFELDETGWQ